MALEERSHGPGSFLPAELTSSLFTVSEVISEMEKAADRLKWLKALARQLIQEATELETKWGFTVSIGWGLCLAVRWLMFLLEIRKWHES